MWILALGMQLMAQQLEGKVERSEKREYGKADLEFAAGSTLAKGIEGEHTVTGQVSGGTNIQSTIRLCFASNGDAGWTNERVANCGSHR